MSDPCIFIVDDDADIRASLSRSLKTRGYEVEAFASASEFLASDAGERPGCLILDYGLPEVSGLELQETLVKRGAPLPIIFITGHGGVSEAVQAMKHGAVDFLEKPFRQEVLLARIEAALKLNANSRRKDATTQDAATRFARLTEREKEVASILVLKPAQSSSKDVARLLGISPRTVDHHRARILEKMGTSSVAELVNLAMAAKLFPGGAGPRI
jgi:two-component system response regulator FixJ